MQNMNNCFLHVYSVAYVLLTSKFKREYMRMFQAIKSLCPDVKPDRLMIDFETAVRGAAFDVLEVEHVAGCNFHFRQATGRKRQKTPSLVTAYYASDSVRRTCDMLDALAFLPVDQVRKGKIENPFNIR